MYRAHEIIKLAEEVTKTKAQEITNSSEIPTDTSYIYIVTNGEDVLQLGKTMPSKGTKSKGRLLSLLKGSPPSIHNKSFIVGLAEVALNKPNKFYILEVKDSDVIEKVIHTRLGIRTNRDACVFIDNRHWASIKDSEKHLFELFKNSQYFKNNFNGGDSSLVELVFCIVKSGLKFKRDSGKTAKYQSGDVLSGSVLLSADYIKLAPVWQKMCRNYFKYSDYYLNLAKSTILKTEIKTHAIQLEVQGEEDEFEHPVLNFSPPLTVKYSQLLAAQNTLVRNSSQFLTKNFTFETNYQIYIFVVEKPGKNISKIKDILQDLKLTDLEFHELELTGRANETQFKTGLGSCYFETRVRGFANNRMGCFSQI